MAAQANKPGTSKNTTNKKEKNNDTSTQAYTHKLCSRKIHHIYYKYLTTWHNKFA